MMWLCNVNFTTTPTVCLDESPNEHGRFRVKNMRDEKVDVDAKVKELRNRNSDKKLESNEMESQSLFNSYKKKDSNDERSEKFRFFRKKTHFWQKDGITE